ncbi:hypothetical protein PRZ48_006168 [Zasmidium cellare]|uniref:Bola-like protein n=1 Tax=Zasmidium cellare TaxID=395010 RepID=A0ABR0EMC7_ZASCE|nr:hypothetical protein PRZ48_006168 [Zasmidium cellare]
MAQARDELRLGGRAGTTERSKIHDSTTHQYLDTFTNPKIQSPATMTSIRILTRTIRPTSRFTGLTSSRSPARTQQPLLRQPLLQPHRHTSTTPSPPDYLDDRERDIFTKLTSTFSPTTLEVQDVSGGCGSMYAVEIASEKFKGLPLLKQHRLVKDALGEDVKKWHGFQLRTKVPE